MTKIELLDTLSEIENDLDHPAAGKRYPMDSAMCAILEYLDDRELSAACYEIRMHPCFKFKLPPSEITNLLPAERP